MGCELSGEGQVVQPTIADDAAPATPDLPVTARNLVPLPPELCRARDFTADAPGHHLVRSGSRRESHPPAPTEPCVTVSRYTALVTLVSSSVG